MPKIFLSPSTQEWNQYVTGGNEEEYMNLLADRMEPYLRSSGITYVRNDPSRNVVGAISDSNAGNFDVHLALHSNAAPERLAGKLRGIDIYFSPSSYDSERLATIIANNLKSIYPLPDKTRAVPTTSLGEVTQTRAVAVLCELGYHDNVEDVTWLKNNLEPSPPTSFSRFAIISEYRLSKQVRFSTELLRRAAQTLIYAITRRPADKSSAPFRTGQDLPYTEMSATAGTLYIITALLDMQAVSL